MPFKKVDSPVLKKLNDRINGLKAIHPNLVFKNGLSVAAAEKLKDEFTRDQNELNTMLALYNRKRADLAEFEKKLGDCSKNIFFSLRSEFGDDSLEYEQGGGVRVSQRAKKTRKPKKT
jgi:hypothetical protein